MTSRATVRQQVFYRDNAICWVCEGEIELFEYELGHLQDEATGGTLGLDNLAAMHYGCNRSIMPVFASTEDALAWRSTFDYDQWCASAGYPIAQVRAMNSHWRECQSGNTSAIRRVLTKAVA